MKSILLLIGLLVCYNAPAYTPGKEIKRASTRVNAFQPTPSLPQNIYVLNRYGKIQSPSTDNVNNNGSVVGTSGISRNGKIVLIVLPTVTTTSITYTNQTTVTTGGNVTASGNGTITARGVCWGTSANPTISNSKTSDGTGLGTFSSTISSLNMNDATTYHVRAYATNGAGTAYGSDVTFNMATYWNY